MSENSCSVIPGSIVGNKRDSTIAKRMWAILNQKVPMEEVREPYICLVVRAWLYRQCWEAQVHIQKINQSIPYVFKVQLFCW